MASGDCLVSCWQLAEEMEIGRTGPFLCVPTLPRGPPSPLEKHLCSLLVVGSPGDEAGPEAAGGMCASEG